MKILSFAGSNSSQSINHQLLTYVQSLNEESIELVRLNDYEIPMYGIDLEQAGWPAGLEKLNEAMGSADAFIISVAEHNGNVTASFKSTIDWLSRINRRFLENKKILVLSTSPGGGGAANALAITQKTLPFFGGEVVDAIAVPKFQEVVQDGKVIDESIQKQIAEGLGKLMN